MFSSNLFHPDISGKVRQSAGLAFKGSRAVLLPLFFALITASPAIAQQKASEHLKSLRTHLSESEATYAGVLTAHEQNPKATIRLEDLREDLRWKFKDYIDNVTSSEAKLAILRADAEATHDAIRAYETSLPTGPGEFTTSLNIYTDSELINMQKSASDTFASLKLDIMKSLPEKQSISLESRMREVQGWKESLDAEIVRRQSLKAGVELKEIRSDITVQEARTRFDRIGSVDGSSEHFQKRLGYQVRMRLQSAPQNASLKMIEASLPTIKPPVISLTTPRGPPESIKVAEQQLRLAQADELHAITLRDPVKIAKARASIAMNREWIVLKIGKPSGIDKMGLSLTSTENLLDIHDKLRDWQAHLYLEQQANPDDLLVTAQLKDAEKRSWIIDMAVEDRLMPRPPPDNGGFNGDLPDNPSGPDSPDLLAFERKWDRQTAHNEVLELGRAYNEFSDITDVTIPEALNNSIQDRILAEARSLKSAYLDILQLEREIFIEGRGTETAQAGKQLRVARENIQAAAGELLDPLSVSKSAKTKTFQEVKALVGDFATKKATTGSSYSQALDSVEHARQTLKASKPAQVEIHSVRSDISKSGPDQRIQLKQIGNPPKDSGGIKRPSEYRELYPEKSRQKLQDYLKDPRKAPGGIIFDASLPDELARRIQALNVDINTGVIKAKIADAWLPLKLKNDPLIARLAWGFVLDERSAVIDLRPLGLEEASWLAQQYGIRGISPSQKSNLIESLTALTSVNINDALQDSVIVPHLILADQLMFDLLPSRSILIENNRWAGISVDELRQAFRTDVGNELNNPSSKEILFKKSLIEVNATDYRADSELLITPRFSFHLFGVPSRGNEILTLKESERWFNRHQKELQTLPQLSNLSDFVAMAALFRSVREYSIENNLDELIAVPVPVSSVPRYLVRNNAQRLNQLRTSLSTKEN